MPWPVYGKMSTLEIRAIYEYLRAIPSLPTPTPPSAASQLPDAVTAFDYSHVAVRSRVSTARPAVHF